MYAQTNIQLFNQLKQERYSAAELVRIRNAYELALELFTAQYRASGKTFIAHVVGTASILSSLHMSGSIVAAGLIHSAYSEGDFGDLAKGVSNSRRNRVASTVGQEVEDYVYRYTMLPKLENIENIDSYVDSLDSNDRDALLISLVDKLEIQLDLGVLYTSNPEQRKKKLHGLAPVMVKMAEKLGFPVLASELTRALHEILSAQTPKELRGARDRIFTVMPSSWRKRLRLIAHQKLVRKISRFRYFVRSLKAKRTSNSEEVPVPKSKM